MSGDLKIQIASQRAALLWVLRRDHRGRANGIAAVALARKIGRDERTLRTLASELRAAGVAVVVLPQIGYFVAEVASEIDEYCAILRSRALHCLVVESRLRDIPLPARLDPRDPLHLPT